MQNSRTKQIKTYGKRAKRIIDAPSGTAIPSTEILSIFEDLPAAPLWKNVAAKMKKRENQPPLKVLSPKVVGLKKKRRLSPVLSPIGKNQSLKIPKGKRLTVVPFDCSATHITTKVQRVSTVRQSIPTSSLSPSRAPLSSVPLNVTASPAIMQQRRLTSGNKSLKSKRLLTPLVNVDIIVLDDNGHTISKERRVSKDNVDVNPINKIPTSRMVSGNHKSVPSAICDSEEELESQTLRRPKRHVARKKMVVSSDDENSEQEYAPTPKLGKPLLPSKPSRLIAEVHVPSPPYKILLPAVLPKQMILPPQLTSLEASIPLPPSPIMNATVPCDIPSPAFKPRRLTPIKARHNSHSFRPSSPAAMTDLDLSLDFSELNLDLESFATINDFQAPQYLKPLLTECHQETCGPHNFSTFIETFQYDPVLRSWDNKYSLDMGFKKIGEASYSEVFGIGDVVLKIIPLRDELKINQNEEIEGPAPTDAQDVRKEIIVTRAMGDVYGGFIKLLKTYVVKGRYPEVLLRLWDEYNEQKGSESIRPGQVCLRLRL